MTQFSRCDCTIISLPSNLGFPRTLSTSALMGFCPRARMTSPHWLQVIFPSPVRSNNWKASLNSAMKTDKHSRLQRFWRSRQTRNRVWNHKYAKPKQGCLHKTITGSKAHMVVHQGATPYLVIPSINYLIKPPQINFAHAWNTTVAVSVVKEK